ncbi:MAG TPA: hypothetical protein VN282_10905 [Pyrinomonadaceae bacterium]|nr:hypothetical protein [Pyrinomonadaceae bacterium]
MESPVKARLLLLAALLSAVCALALAPARAGQRVPPYSSMLDGAVTYTLPAGWRIIMYINTSRGGGAEIINTKELARPQTRLFLSADPLREEKTVEDMIHKAFENKYRRDGKVVVLSEKSDGANWRTAVWTKDINGQPNLVLGRFGVVNRKFVDLSLHVPLGSGDVKWMKQMVEDFNAVCESLKIDGQGSFESKVSTDIITEQLKVNAKK